MQKMKKDHNNKVARLKQDEDLPKVQQFLEGVISRAKVPGISVAMNVNGVLLEAAAGISDAQTMHPMTTDMHFELGCLNKLFTAIVVLELVSENRVDLDQGISHYLPEMKGLTAISSKYGTCLATPLATRVTGVFNWYRKWAYPGKCRGGDIQFQH